MLRPLDGRILIVIIIFSPITSVMFPMDAPQTPPSQTFGSSPQRPLSSSSSSQKGLISYVRTLPKNSIVWIQGTIVGLTENQISIDDSSAIARVQFNQKRDAALNIEALRPGAYVMVVGQMCAKLKGFRMGMRAFTIRDLTPNAAFLQTLWNLEVVDAYLHHRQSETQQQQHFDN